MRCLLSDRFNKGTLWLFLRSTVFLGHRELERDLAYQFQQFSVLLLQPRKLCPGRRTGCSFYHPTIDGPFRDAVLLGGLGHRDAFFLDAAQDIGFYVGCNTMMFFVHMTPG